RREAVRGMGRDTEPDLRREEALDPLPQLRELLHGRLGGVAEDLEVDERAQAELRCSDSCSSAVAAVGDGRDARGEALGGTEPRRVEHLLEPDATLALRVQVDPCCEVADP